MSLQDFLVYDENINQKVQKQEQPKQEPLLLEDRKFYVYALLDPRFDGARIYRDLRYVFNHPVFYIGKGYDLRYEGHFKEADNLWEKPEEIKKYYNPFKIRKIHQIYKDNDLPRVIIIKENLTEQEAFELEKYCIKQIGRKDKKEGPLTNLTDGGDGVCGKIYTEEENRKNSERNMGEKNGMYGKQRTKEWRKNHSEFMKNNNPSKRKEVKEKISNKCKGHKVSEKTKQRISQTKKNIPKTDEIKQKISETMKRNGTVKGKNNPMYGSHYYWVYNPIIKQRKRNPLDQPIPEGWIKGKGPHKKLFIIS